VIAVTSKNVAMIAYVAPLSAMAQEREREEERRNRNPHHGSLALPVTGSFSPSTTSGPLSFLGSGNFTGTFDVRKFAVQDGKLVAIGTLMGTFTNAAGETRTLVLGDVVAPVTDPPLTCPVLDLTLGPLHLDLLGLVVDLNMVHLTLTAVPEAGNLVGNLLCAVVNLLNGGGPLTAVAGLLNSILGALGL